MPKKSRTSKTKKTSKKARTSRTRVAAPRRSSVMTQPMSGDLASAMSSTQPMMMSAPAASNMMTPMQLVAMFGSLFVTNALVLAGVNWLFPTQLVLGTNLLSPFWALLYATGVLTLIIVGLVPVIELLAAQLRLKISDMQWMALYMVINIGALWIVGRFAEIVGLGVASWLVVVLVSVVLNMVQGLVVTQFVSKVK